jgi:hypothetical protein
MNVLAPALIFSAFASKDFDLYASRGVILGAIGVVVGSGLLAWPFARLLHEDVRTFVPPMMFNNCGNMGLPRCWRSGSRALGDGRDLHDLQPAVFHRRRAHHQPARRALAGVSHSDGHRDFCWLRFRDPASADSRLADAGDQDDRRGR